jgi:hypothetical protein
MTRIAVYGAGGVMDAGVHLPLVDFSGEGFSHRRLAETVDAARESGFAAVSAAARLRPPGHARPRV